jgi:ATP:ADP antiporter, AAA family
MQAAGEYKDFSRLRRFLWPVHRYELKKLVPMLLIFFLLSFDYNVLRCMKDTLVITAENSGAEVIPFIKVWAMFPTSVLMTYIFIRLSNRYTREKVFYVMLSIFLLYFFVFTFFLYPSRELIHPHATADRLQAWLPQGMKGFVAMYRYWMFTSFYVMAELWGNIVLFLLFWGFANQVTKIDEAKRFYGLFGIGTNFSGIAAGQISIFLSQISLNSSNVSGKDAWGESMTLIISLVLLAGVLAIAIFHWLNKHALKDARLAPPVKEESQEDKQKFSMRENLKFLATSKYVICITAIVFAYNVVINLVEVLWKQEVLALHPDPLAYNIYMNEITTFIGIVATLTSLLVSGNSIRKFGWTFTAMITPAILLVTSIGFFGFFFLKSRPDFVLGLFGIAPLSIVVFFGSLQNIMSRAAKYTVFDATKEMTFIPLKHDEKIKSKAAIDGVCNRLGKSSGSVIYQVLLLAVSSITACVPYVAVCLFGIIGIWMIAVKSLGKRFQELTSNSPTPTPAPAAPSTEVSATAAAPAAA